jgi:peptidoglycan/LPS O-acetylase OafA/YrhL
VATDAAAPRSRPTRAALAVVAAVAYSWVAGHFTTFTRQAEIATFIPGLVGVIVAFRVRPRSDPRPGRSRRGWLAWWLIVVAVCAIELASLLLGATHAYPTISDLVNPWLDSTASRAAVFGLWLAFGYWLTRR